MQSLNLYSNPAKESSVQCEIKEYIPEQYDVLDYDGLWLKIRIIHNGKNMRVGYRQTCNAVIHILHVGNVSKRHSRQSKIKSKVAMENENNIIKILRSNESDSFCKVYEKLKKKKVSDKVLKEILKLADNLDNRLFREKF